MHRAIFYSLFISISVVSCSISKNNSSIYDQKLAESLEADEYGMRSYQFVILKTGATKISDKDSVSKLFSGHMENIGRLADAGNLVVAGPFGKNDKQFRGLFILKVKTREEAETLLQTDPAIKAGVLAAEIYPWYGSAALPMYLPYSKKITKKNY